VRLTSDGQEAKQPERLEALPAASRRLVSLLVEARLLVSGKGADGDQVEIAHEALLRTWPKLVRWIEKGREALQQRQLVRRLAEDLSADAPEGQRRQALEQIAALAAAGGSEADAVRREAHQPLVDLLTAAAPLDDREDAALVLAMIDQAEPLEDCLADIHAPVALRRRAAESLGLLARRSGDEAQGQRIRKDLEAVLRSTPLDLRIAPVSDPKVISAARQSAQITVAAQVAEERASGQLAGVTQAQLVHRIQQEEEMLTHVEIWASGQAPGWAEHDAHLPILQGAARGIQLGVASDLPLLGMETVRKVPMLVLTAKEEEGGLRITTEVILRNVWKLPLPAGEQIEMVEIPGGEHRIGSPSEEAGRDKYTKVRQGCDGVDVEAERTVRLEPFLLVRHPITQAQWRSVVEAIPERERGQLKASPGSFQPDKLWERHGQPGALPVDSVSWNECRQWLEFLNGWLRREWAQVRGVKAAPQLELPSETQWEVACRAGSGTPFHFGATVDASWARYENSYTYGMGRRGESSQKPPAVVGFSGLVNRWGLADLHGQLQEWCADRWHPSPLRQKLSATGSWMVRSALESQAPMDGQAWDDKDPSLGAVPQEQEMRLLRGGSWFSQPRNCRAATRNSYRPDGALHFFGFRPCCLLAPDTQPGS
jgi:formylglycine-generating enzyme required for sulfatase activity